MLKCFLEDVEVKKYISVMVRNIVKEIKEIVYDVEDIIEIFFLEEGFGKISSIRKRVRRFFCVMVKCMGFVFDMKVISNRIFKVICDM